MPLRPHHRFLFASLALWVSGCGLSGPPGPKTRWPEMPAPQLVTHPSNPRDSLGPRRAVFTRHELQARVVQAGAHYPMISDARYVAIYHDELPALLDWYAALLDVYGFTPEMLQKDGFLRERSIRLLRIFVAMGIQRTDPTVKAAPALGMVRVNLRQPWGDLPAGDTRDFLLVDTELGLFVIDPVSRRIRPLEYDPFLWRLEATRF